MKYIINFDLIDEFIEKEKSLIRFAQSCGVNPGRLQNCRSYQGGMDWDEVVKIAGYCGLTAEKIAIVRDPKVARTYITKKNDEVEPLSDSERVLMGLKENISKRLSMHSLPFINEIQDIVNQIIIESSYLGVIANKSGQSDFVLNAVRRRQK